MKVSVIISIYKRLDNLELILMGLERQSFTDFEVIVSEDNDALETKTFLENYRKNSSFKIKHVFQEDLGFRKNKALNQSLRLSEGEIIAFLDGDCVPHKHFLKEYVHNVKEKTACFGRRVFLDKDYSQRFLQEKDFKLLTLTRLAFHVEEGFKYGFYLPYDWINTLDRAGIYGCNWAILKKHLLEINGFDEDYVIAGVGEDSDVEWRLEKIGVKLQSTRNKSLVYHLYHNPNYSDADIEHNHKIYWQKVAENNFYCLNGLTKVEK
jgi:cellulose synthase/poly-beta-1,6-N-acetylglucosamine synthase-like glycosyltransferase